MSVSKEISIDTVEEELKKCQIHAERFGWVISDIDLEQLVFRVQIKSPVDNEEYLLEIKFDNYPEWPLCIEFIDPTSGRGGIKSAYPAGKGKAGSFFHGNACICHPSNRLAYINLHREWNLSGWKQNSKVTSLTNLEAILLAIYHRIDNAEFYAGRMHN